MNVDPRDYFERREREERAAAKNAGSMQARRIHQELAQSYAERALRLGDCG
jgi:hypothetical protein